MLPHILVLQSGSEWLWSCPEKGRTKKNGTDCPVLFYPYAKHCQYKTLILLVLSRHVESMGKWWQGGCFSQITALNVLK